MLAFGFLRRSASLLAVAVVTSGLNAAELPPLTLDDLFTTPSLTGVAPSTPRWSPDSTRFAFTWNRDGLPSRQLFIAAGNGRDLRHLGQDTSSSVRDIAWLPDSEHILSLRGDQLWSTSVDSGQNTLLGTPGSDASNLSVAPDGSTAAWLQKGDLWLFDLQERSAVAATDVGIASLSAIPAGRYSRPEREIGPGIWGGPTYAWSPDGQTIAVHHVDRRDMRSVPFPAYLEAETAPNEVRRGYPGDANEQRTVGLLDVASRELRLLDLDNPAGNQVVGFDWSPTGELLLDIASDTAVDRWLYVVDRASGERRKIWHSNRPTRIYTSFAATWHPDGRQVVFLSDIRDRYGLYAIDSTVVNDTPQLLTDPGYDVLSSPTVVADAIVYTANGNGAAERHAYRLATNGGESQQITHMPGQNAAHLSPDGRWAAIVHSNDTSPPEIYTGGANGDDVRRVTHSPLPGFGQREWASARYVSFPSKVDDYSVHARLLEPPDLDPDKRYPVIFGPMYSNSARNRWAGVYSAVQQLLVQKGYIVVQVDVRGSTGYGRAFREEFLGDFAGGDIEDIASAVSYLSALPYVDPERLGIWGSSYGGTLTVYTLLTKPGLFRAGVAAAAAVDPYFFGTDDVAIVRRPDTHPDVFEKAASRHAANLEDHLLIMHGMLDQVVPFKTTVALADILIREGKDFDYVFAPGATHAWSREAHYARFMFGKLIAHFDRYLKPATQTPETE